MSNKRKVGPYILGPSIGPSPVKSITQFVARHHASSQFHVVKLLTLKTEGDETADDKQGKMLLHTEHSLLLLLRGEKGVIQHHGLFQELTVGKMVKVGKKRLSNKKEIQRVCLVTDCVVAHDFDPESSWRVNLQQFLLKEKRLNEREALFLFLGILDIVERLHAKNVVHRDLKLGNMLFDCRSKQLTLINFSLGKHLSSDKELLRDQRGSPAYISPDVLSGKPYKGKASDMWALGVVLYTVLFGQFPFFDASPQDLFRKIRTADYNIPGDRNVSESACDLIRGLLTLDPAYRFTASQAKEKTCAVVVSWRNIMVPQYCETNQVVPDFAQSEQESPTGGESAKEEVEETVFDVATREEAQSVASAQSPRAVVVQPVLPRIRTTDGTSRQLTPEELAQILPPMFETTLPIAPPSIVEERPSDAGSNLLAQFMARVMERERMTTGNANSAATSTEPQPRRHRPLRSNVRSLRHTRRSFSVRRTTAHNSFQRARSFAGRRASNLRSTARRGMIVRRSSVGHSALTAQPSQPTVSRVQNYLSELFSAAGAPMPAQFSSTATDRMQHEQSTVNNRDEYLSTDSEESSRRADEERSESPWLDVRISPSMGAVNNMDSDDSMSSA